MLYLVYMCLVIFVGSLLLFINVCLSSFQPYFLKNNPFECGFVSTQQSREPFKISFYIVGILFLLFDVEISFIYPIITRGLEVNWLQITHISMFLGLLSLGIIYEISWAVFKIRDIV